MFQEIDKEQDGIIYVRDVIFYLKSMNDDLENKKVVYHFILKGGLPICFRLISTSQTMSLRRMRLSISSNSRYSKDGS